MRRIYSDDPEIKESIIKLLRQLHLLITTIFSITLEEGKTIYKSRNNCYNELEETKSSHLWINIKMSTLFELSYIKFWYCNNILYSENNMPPLISDKSECLELGTLFESINEAIVKRILVLQENKTNLGWLFDDLPETPSYSSLRSKQKWILVWINKKSKTDYILSEGENDLYEWAKLNSNSFNIIDKALSEIIIELIICIESTSKINHLKLPKGSMLKLAIYCLWRMNLFDINHGNNPIVSDSWKIIIDFIELKNNINKWWEEMPLRFFKLNSNKINSFYSDIKTKLWSLLNLDISIIEDVIERQLKYWLHYNNLSAPFDKWGHSFLLKFLLAESYNDFQINIEDNLFTKSEGFLLSMDLKLNKLHSYFIWIISTDSGKLVNFGSELFKKRLDLIFFSILKYIGYWILFFIALIIWIALLWQLYQLLELFWLIIEGIISFLQFIIKLFIDTFLAVFHKLF
jgi:hypothetical protein